MTFTAESLWLMEDNRGVWGNEGAAVCADKVRLSDKFVLRFTAKLLFLMKQRDAKLRFKNGADIKMEK